MSIKNFSSRSAPSNISCGANRILLSIAATWAALSLMAGCPVQAQSPGGNLGALLARLKADEASIASLQSTVQAQQNTINQMASNGVAPMGPAGGDLIGSFPNPAISASAIDHTKLANDAASLSKVSGGSITTDGNGNMIDTGNINAAGISVSGAVQGRNVVSHGDLILDGLGGGVGNNNHAARALVDNGSDGLLINCNNDFGKVWIMSDATVSGNINAAGISVSGAVQGRNVVSHGDFILDGLGGGVGNNNHAARALVDNGSEGLWINCNNDFGKVRIMSDTAVDGTLTAHSLQVTGGSDLAEPYKITTATQTKPLPGMVVAIDPQQTGQMRVSTHAYDTGVAGIISGANGIKPGVILRQAGTVADGTLPIASVGRVWCYCDADAGGAIAPSDLLTTSNTPGYAMRVGNYNKAKGAILGKAMSSLKSGKVLVLVLVTLE